MTQVSSMGFRRYKAPMIAAASSLFAYSRMYVRALQEALLYFAGRLPVLRHGYERMAPFRLQGPIRSILFVCRANICRSPLAAAYLESILEEKIESVTVGSAGLEAHPIRPAYSVTKVVAKRHRLSLNGHVTTQLSSELVDRFDLLIVMEMSQKKRICRLYPKAKGKTILLGSLDSSGPLEITDPLGRPIEEYESCLERIMRCCDILMRRLDQAETREPLTAK